MKCFKALIVLILLLPLGICGFQPSLHAAEVKPDPATNPGTNISANYLRPLGAISSNIYLDVKPGYRLTILIRYNSIDSEEVHRVLKRLISDHDEACKITWEMERQ